jgi:hypothetical protein
MNRKTGCVVAVLFSTVLFGQQTDFDAMLNVARGLQLQGRSRKLSTSLIGRFGSFPIIPVLVPNWLRCSGPSLETRQTRAISAPQ